MAAGAAVSDFRVQTYEGQPVLTWWEGTPLSLAGPGPGTGYIANTHYHVIATVNAGNGQQGNGHEFQLTPWGTALITISKQVDADLTSVGGPASAPLLEGEVQEVDIHTGAVLFPWDSLDHVPVTDSHAPLPTTPGTPGDYFHINAVRLGADGNVLISARHAWAIYKVDLHTGATIWELGGRHSSFALGAGVEFAWQHDPAPVSASDDGETLQIFDNESNGTARLPASRIERIRLDYRTHTASLLSAYTHPDGLSAPSQGDAQTLANGDVFVGWGQLGAYSELDPFGNLRYDVRLAPGYDTYRAYRDAWAGSPDGPPSVSAVADSAGATTVDCGLDRRHRRGVVAGPRRPAAGRVGAARERPVERPRYHDRHRLHARRPGGARPRRERSRGRALAGHEQRRLTRAPSPQPGGRADTTAPARPARRSLRRTARPVKVSPNAALRTGRRHNPIAPQRGAPAIALQLGDTAPDFEAQTTEGPIRFHEWLGDPCAVLFSHPSDRQTPPFASF